jgi:hypothetical protein
MGLLSKAIRWAGVQPTKKASRGTLGSYTLGVNPMWGQPLPMQVAGDAQGLITPERMREVTMKTPTASACLNAVLDYAGGVDIDVRNVDAAKKIPQWKLSKIRQLLTKPNPMQTQRHFRLALFKDLFTMGYAAIEIERDDVGEPANLWVLDAARLRVDYDEHGTVQGYDMLDARGMPIHRGNSTHGWEPDEVVFFSLNPASSSVYPYSRLSQLFTCAIIEDLMLFFISTRFTDSNVPFGIMDLGDVTEQEVRIAIANWDAQANDQHRILLTGSKGGSKFTPFGYHLKDLEATGLLAEVRGKIMAIVGVTMNELGESQDINKSNGYNLSFTFKKRAIEPMLNEFTQTLTKRLLWDELEFEDSEFYYVEIDSRDELLQAQVDDLYLKMGAINLNAVRNRRGDTNIPGGDANYVFTGSAWIPVELIQQMAETMIQAEQMGGGTMTGPDSTESVRVKVGKPQQTNGSGNGQAGGGKQEGAVHTQRMVTGHK